jgi:TBCC domain-containing protein 1
MSRNSLNSPNSPTTSSKTGANSASQQNLHLQRNISLRTSSLQSLPETQLCAKSHAFSGAVLNPKQARELTPRIVLSITHTLGNYALENANAYSSHGPNSHSAESNSSYNKSNDGHSSSSANINSNEHESKVQYTVWITEAWRCLGWAEPSAALFWEMATMYHTLHVAARSIEVEETEVEEGDGIDAGTDGNGPQFGMIQRTLSQSIPPILSCGSSASMDSVEIKKKERTKEEKSSPTRGGSNPSSSSPRKGSASGGNNNEKQKNSSQSNKASAASAKELPVWLVGMYLLLHCEEGVFRRNVSGEDSQRFDALIMAKQGAPPGVGGIWKDGKGVDFGMLLMQPNLSLR